jgi:antitoxin (DNA-binding transcriptional repressor) of toxin-antitoxin stability system
MRTASVHDLELHVSELLREVADGEIIVIELAGEPIAELRPLSKAPRKPKFRDMTRFWETFPQVPGDSTQFISDDRDR